MSDSPSLPPNEYDQALFENMGHAVIFNIVSVVCETGLWAIYLLCFGWAVRLQIRNPRILSIPNLVILVATFVLFLSSTALWAMNASWLVLSTEGFFLKYPTLSIADRIMSLNGGIITLGPPMEGLFLMSMIIGDSVVIWRAWAICTGTRLRRFVYIPIVMLSASIVFSCISINCLVSAGFEESKKSSIPVGSRTCQWAEPIAWAISLLTNAVSTGIIAVRAWEHHRFLRQGHINTSQCRSQRIMLTLIESGFVYCLFWLTQLHLFFGYHYDSTFLSFLHAVLNAVGDQISGLYPTLIIILVNTQRSLSDDVANMPNISISVGTKSDSALTVAGTSSPKPSSASPSPTRRKFAPTQTQVSSLLFASRGEVDMESVDLEKGSVTATLGGERCDSTL